VVVYETKEGRGAVVGEFVVHRFWSNYNNNCGGKSCLTDIEILKYGNGKAYGWEISDVVVYDVPNVLQEFGFDRAPQSWCYLRDGADSD
jgi:hypothetical protein